MFFGLVSKFWCIWYTTLIGFETVEKLGLIDTINHLIHYPYRVWNFFLFQYLFSNAKIWYTTLIGFETWCFSDRCEDFDVIWYTTLIGFETDGKIGDEEVEEVHLIHYPYRVWNWWKNRRRGGRRDLIHYPYRVWNSIKYPFCASSRKIWYTTLIGFETRECSWLVSRHWFDTLPL